jgi:Uma2 family endonuclease
MSRIGSKHAACINRLNRLFVTRLGNCAVVHVQNPIRLDRFTETTPDLAVLKPRADDYEASFPDPHEVYLIVEVSENTLQSDRIAKIPMYARAGIPDVWMIDLSESGVEIYQAPSPMGWRHLDRKAYDDTWTISAFAHIPFSGKDVFG